jgi:hypothetical protein
LARSWGRIRGPGRTQLGAVRGVPHGW